MPCVETVTYDSGLNGSLEPDSDSDSQDNTRYYAHCDDGQYWLNRECHDEGGEEERHALKEVVQLLRDACVDATTVCTEILSVRNAAMA